MIYDYLLSINVTLEEVEAKFQESCRMIGSHYNIPQDTEFHKMEIMMKTHEFFLAAGVKSKKLKPVLILHEVGASHF